jgi:hypothetical protein
MLANNTKPMHTARATLLQELKDLELDKPAASLRLLTLLTLLALLVQKYKY